MSDEGTGLSAGEIQLALLLSNLDRVRENLRTIRHDAPLIAETLALLENVVRAVAMDLSKIEIVEEA